jgi:hypothetical protein
MGAPWTDEEMLEALYLRDHRGLSAANVARRIGKTRNSVLGMFHRVGRDTYASDGTRLDGNKNGSMPPRWWDRDGDPK